MQLETVGEIVRVLRSRLDLEQVELARACGWRDASAVSRIETDRIRPTRRTLLKLADALANPATGDAHEVRTWLFLASGILPTAPEIDELGTRLPAIESWGQPAIIVDFGWHIWRSNALMVKMLGLPEQHRGRNYLDVLFERNGSSRQAMGDRWEMAATTAVSLFRADTDKRAGQRWHRSLVARLGLHPDFTTIWDAAEAPDHQEVAERTRFVTPEGPIGSFRLRLTADPRLHLWVVMPEDAQATRSFLASGVMLG